MIAASVAIPGGLKEGFVAASASGWPWHWLTDGNLRMSGGGDKLVMLPVRGNADIETEKALLASGTLTAHQVLRVRALDFQNPVFSAFRCNLWKDARLRFESEPPRLDPAWKNVDAMRFLYDEIMTLDGVPLKPAGAEQVIVLKLADAAGVTALKAALRGGTLTTSCGAGLCAVDLTAFGTLIDAHVKSVEAAGGAPLLAARAGRLCKVIADFENKPGLPEVTCR